jgi:hypothetical protein
MCRERGRRANYSTRNSNAAEDSAQHAPHNAEWRIGDTSYRVDDAEHRAHLATQCTTVWVECTYAGYRMQKNQYKKCSTKCRAHGVRNNAAKSAQSTQ